MGYSAEKVLMAKGLAVFFVEFLYTAAGVMPDPDNAQRDRAGRKSWGKQ